MIKKNELEIHTCNEHKCFELVMQDICREDENALRQSAAV